MNARIFMGDVMTAPLVSGAALIVADPPYGNVLPNAWDKTKKTQEQFADWMLDWVNRWRGCLVPGGSFYVWGGIGSRGFRPFFHFCSVVERETGMRLANVITWRKRRAYGKPDDYLFVREEIAWLVNGDKPATFHVPLTEQLRGYAGYNPDYPAKSEFFRRGNVWEETEIMRGKVHPAQKAPRVASIPIEVHTNPGDLVIDLFAGSGETSVQARSLGRCSYPVESDPETCSLVASRVGLLPDDIEDCGP